MYGSKAGLTGGLSGCWALRGPEGPRMSMWRLLCNSSGNLKFDCSRVTSAFVHSLLINWKLLKRLEAVWTFVVEPSFVLKEAPSLCCLLIDSFVCHSFVERSSLHLKHFIWASRGICGVSEGDFFFFFLLQPLCTFSQRFWRTKTHPKSFG